MYKGLRKEGVIQLTKNGVAFEASRHREGLVRLFIRLMLHGGALHQHLKQIHMFKRFSKPKKKPITLCNLNAV